MDVNIEISEDKGRKIRRLQQYQAETNTDFRLDYDELRRGKIAILQVYAAQTFYANAFLRRIKNDPDLRDVKFDNVEIHTSAGYKVPRRAGKRILAAS